MYLTVMPLHGLTRKHSVEWVDSTDLLQGSSYNSPFSHSARTTLKI